MAAATAVFDMLVQLGQLICVQFNTEFGKFFNRIILLAAPKPHIDR